MCGRALSPAGHICALPGAWGEPLMSPSCQRLMTTSGHQPSGLHNLTKARCCSSSLPPVLSSWPLASGSPTDRPPLLGICDAERVLGSGQIWVAPHRTVALQCDPPPQAFISFPHSLISKHRGVLGPIKMKQNSQLIRNASVHWPSLCCVPVGLHVYLSIYLPIHSPSQPAGQLAIHPSI